MPSEVTTMSDKKIKKLSADVRDLHTTLATILAELRTIREYMAEDRHAGKFKVSWVCPHCETAHEWYWDEPWEAHTTERSVMVCNVCGGKTWCVGDGKGHFTPESTLASIALEANQL